MMQKLRIQVLSFVLILFLAPKMGMEMYVHHLLHQKDKVQVYHSSHSTRVSTACSCVEDATMPVTKTDPYVLVIPLRQVHGYMLSGITPFHFLTVHFLDLRGPPLFSTLVSRS